MNEKQLSSDPIDLPFYIVDAWAERLTHEPLSPKVTLRRHQLSNGSSRIDLLISQKPIGCIDLVAFRADTTLLVTIAYSDNDQSHRHLLNLMAGVRTYLLRIMGEGLHFDVDVEPIRTDLREWSQSTWRAIPPNERQDIKRGAPSCER